MNWLKYFNWDWVFFLDTWLSSQKLLGEILCCCILSEVSLVHHSLFKPWNLRPCMLKIEFLLIFFLLSVLGGESGLFPIQHHLSWDSCPLTFPSVFQGTVQNIPYHSNPFTPLVSCTIRSLLIYSHSFLFLFHHNTALTEVWWLWSLPYSCLTPSWLFCPGLFLQAV